MPTTILSDDFSGSGPLDGTTPDTPLGGFNWVSPYLPIYWNHAIDLSGGYAVSADTGTLDLSGEAYLGTPEADGSFITEIDPTLRRLEATVHFRTGPSIGTDPTLYQTGLSLAFYLGGVSVGMDIYAAPTEAWSINVGGGSSNATQEFTGIAPNTDYEARLTVGNNMQRLVIIDPAGPTTICDLQTFDEYANEEGLCGLFLSVGVSLLLADISVDSLDWAELYGTMPSPNLSFTALGTELSFAGTMPAPRLVMNVLTGSPVPAIGSMPRPILRFEEAGFITGSMPRPTLAMTGTSTSTATIAGSMPRPTVDFRVQTIESARIVGTMPRPTLVMQGGGEFVGSMPAPTLAFDVLSARMATFAGSMPRPALDFRVLAAGSMTFAGTMPALIPGPYGAITGSMPRPRLNFSIEEVVSALYEAYSLNLKHLNPKRNDELTRYTNFPFVLGFFRYKGQHFGMAADGVYQLTGTTDYDATPTAVPWAVKTASSDLGADTKKTPVSAYFGGRIGPAATVKVYARDDANTETDYDYSTPAEIVAQNYRQKFGKGLKARYIAFGLEGDGELALDTLGLEIANLKRRL